MSDFYSKEERAAYNAAYRKRKRRVLAGIPKRKIPAGTVIRIAGVAFELAREATVYAPYQPLLDTGSEQRS